MRSLFAVVLVLLSASVVHAQAPHAHRRRLAFDVRVDVPTGLALGITGATLVTLRGDLAHRSCVLTCSPSEVDALDAAGRQLRWSDDTGFARQFGDVIGYGGVAGFGVTAALLGMTEDETFEEALEDAWIVGEAFAAAHVLESTLKFTIGRARPVYTYGLAWEVEDPTDLFTTMVSGHATVGYAVAVATGMVATLRGRPSAPALWVTGLAIATFSSYMRIAADRHYVTDVIAGAVLGSTMGVLVPLLFHARARPAVMLTPQVSAEGAMLSVSGAF